MIVLWRILFGGALLYAIVTSRRYAATHVESGDVMNAFNLAVCVVLGIVNAILWAPYIGAKFSEPLTAPLTQSTYVGWTNHLLRLIHWAERRGWKRLTALLCFLEGVNHPDQPAAFVIGLKQARRGSWLEKVYAREVFKFDNAQNCVLAYEALKRHGLKPGPHRNPEVNMMLYSLQRSIQPDPPKVAVPPAPAPPEPKRNARIQLFKADDKPQGG